MPAVSNVGRRPMPKVATPIRVIVMEKRPLAPDPVAEVPEDERPERTHRKAGGKGEESEDVRRIRLDAGVEALGKISWRGIRRRESRTTRTPYRQPRPRPPFSTLRPWALSLRYPSIPPVLPVIVAASRQSASPVRLRSIKDLVTPLRHWQAIPEAAHAWQFPIYPPQHSRRRRQPDDARASDGDAFGARHPQRSRRARRRGSAQRAQGSTLRHSDHRRGHGCARRDGTRAHRAPHRKRSRPLHPHHHDHGPL